MDNYVDHADVSKPDFPTTSSNILEKKSNGRRRTKGFLKSIVERMESLLLTQINRRPTWLNDLISRNNERWVPVQSMLERMQTVERIDVQKARASNGFLSLLRQSTLLEMDADGTQIRARLGEFAGVRQNADCVLYVDNLPGRADDSWLRNLFSHFGRLIDAWVVQPKNKAALKARAKEEEEKRAGKTQLAPSGHRKNKGFGFVQFAQPDAANRLLDTVRRRSFATASIPGTSVEKTSSHCSPNPASSASTSVSALKRKLVDDIDGGIEAKRSRNTASSSKDLLSPKRVRNGRLSSDGEDIAEKMEQQQQPLEASSGTSKRPRNRRMYRTKRRQRVHQNEETYRMVSNLRIYSWSEWHDLKKSYLTKQRENYSVLKTQLKSWRSSSETSERSLLKKNYRYRKDGKELRGRDKLLLKATSMQKQRSRSIVKSDQAPIS